MTEIQFQQVTYGGDMTHDFTKRQLFLNYTNPVEIIVNLQLNFTSDIPFILSEFRKYVSKDIINTTHNSFIVSNKEVFVDCHINESGSPFSVSSRQVYAKVAGTIEAVKALYNNLHKYIKTDDVYVHWWYRERGGLDSLRFTIEDTKVFRKEHYPFIKNAESYAETFIASSASILILLGDPGTGKTSLIRHILKTSGKEAFVTYDDDVMHDDSLYTGFLSSDSAKFLILEDADLIMVDRQRDGNRVMSKILNAADGLVSFNDKKIIFTANIRDINKIDEALLRPGRCFDVINFRPLQGEEIAKVCEVNNITKKQNKEMTLAEIFN